jgi:hypothetical protein
MTILCVTALGQGDGPPNGYVPDEKTAVAVAEAVLSPVYGSKHIKHERPFKAALNNGVWRVSGTLNCGKLPAGTICVGGTAVVEIQKSDGRIISMVHHK